MKIAKILNEAENKVHIKIKNKNLEETNSKTGTAAKFKGASIEVTKNSITQELVLTKAEANTLLGTLQEFLS
jgi:hypothetical protein